MSNTAIVPTRRSIWRTTFYALLGLALLLMAFYTYAKFEEHLEWKRIDELLAEQDRKHPHWRWHEFLPKPLQPGEVNGALRFIEVGKKLTDEMLVGTEIPDEDYLEYQKQTKDWQVTLQRDSIKRNLRFIREKCKHFEREIPRLLQLQAGCEPLSFPRPSAGKSAFDFEPGERTEPPLFQDHDSYRRAVRWLRILTEHFIEEGKGDNAVMAWRAFLAASVAELPGRQLTLVRPVCFYLAIDLLTQLLGKTEPSDAALRDLQQAVIDWRQHLYTLDDVQIDRAWIVQFLKEMSIESRDTFFAKVEVLYAQPPSWLPKKVQEWLAEHGYGAPSHAAMFRMEYQSHLRLLAFLEEKVKTGQPFVNEDSDLMHDHTAIPGAHIIVYFQPRWKKMLADIVDLQEKLLCMEALIAAERFRLTTGDYPKQWNDLVPTLLKEIPKSDDKQFILKPVPEGLVIYLPGEKDHGGKVLRTYNPETKELDWETDQGLMIFYPKHRRQPPPPVKPKEKQDE